VVTMPVNWFGSATRSGPEPPRFCGFAGLGIQHPLERMVLTHRAGSPDPATVTKMRATGVILGLSVPSKGLNTIQANKRRLQASSFQPHALGLKTAL
jgi:hypothetical protein